MKKIDDFKREKVILNDVHGSSHSLVRTGGGSFHGMDYDSDVFRDYDRDGRWGIGESLTLINGDQTVGQM